MLSGFADFERKLIRPRTGEGTVRALARGVELGRKPRLTRDQIKEILYRKQYGEAVQEVARSYNVRDGKSSYLSDAALGLTLHWGTYR